MAYFLCSLYGTFVRLYVCTFVCLHVCMFARLYVSRLYVSFVRRTLVVIAFLTLSLIPNFKNITDLQYVVYYVNAYYVNA
jgi:hypothetical protein